MKQKERKIMTTIDPISLEIQWQRLVAIADEIDNAVIRTSFSTIVGESHDFGCAIMDASGAGLTQAQWSPPQFCTMLPRTTRDMLKRFPAETLNEGDVLATNDPWIGSTHLPDYNLVSPVFHRGKLVAFMGTVAHVSDVGGHLGDLEASDMFMEGTRLMPNKFYADGEVVPIVEEFIAANCRVPEMVLGDLHAIVGTHRIGIKRVQEFLDDYQMEDVAELSEAIQGRSEQALRNAIEALPDGVSEYEITADGYLEPFTLRIRLEIRGSDMYMDFAGSSPQQWHSAINAAFNISYSTAVYPIKCMLAAHIPNNDGLVRPLHITAPEGSIVNCTFPAPVKARAKVIKHIPPLIFGALAELLPDEAIAAAGGIFPFHVVGQGRALWQLRRPHAAPRRPRRYPGGRRTATRSVSPQQHGHAHGDYREAVPGHHVAQEHDSGFGRGRQTARRAGTGDRVAPHRRGAGHADNPAGSDEISRPRPERRRGRGAGRCPL